MSDRIETNLSRRELTGLLLIAASYARSTVEVGEFYVDAAPAIAALMELAAEALQ